MARLINHSFGGNVAKKIVGYIKLQIPAGKANPSPPVGPALGQRGINIMDFCKAFNAQTQSQNLDFFYLQLLLLMQIKVFLL